MSRDCFIVALGAAFMTTAAPNVAVALDNPLTVTVSGLKSHLQEATATIFGAGSGVLVDVTRVRQFAQSPAVTLNAGACDNPGAVAYRLAPFAKYGSVTQLPHSLEEIAAHARSMVIHETDDVASPPAACGTIVD